MNCEIDGSPKQIAYAKAILRAFAEKVENLTPDEIIVFGLTDANVIIDNKELISSGNATELVGKIGAVWHEMGPVDEYHTLLLEKGRSPSRGGNTSAIHSHRLTINGHFYFFKARGSKKWVYKSDKAEFAWYDDSGKRMIIKGTLTVIDSDEKSIDRGDRRAKPVQRSAGQRLPCSRREARD